MASPRELRDSCGLALTQAFGMSAEHDSVYEPRRAEWARGQGGSGR